MQGFDLSTIQGCYVGSTPASAIYMGSNLIWPTGPHDYLTFEAITAGTVTITATDPSYYLTISYSIDEGQTWTDITTSGTEQTMATLNIGDKLLVKGNNNQYGSEYIDQYATIHSYYNHFGGTAQVEVYGNIMSLIYGDNFVGKNSFPSGSTGNFYRLFYNYSNLIDASNLELPATTLAGGCYISMFRECTSLTTAPVLPATTLANNCYNSMFRDCTSLSTAPELPATTLTDYCYQSMFYGCSSLTEAPTLPATTLTQYCYYSMFRGCTSLSTAPELPATTLASNCYGYMFTGCVALITAPELPATTAANRCYWNMFTDCTNLNYIKCLATDDISTSDDYTFNWVYGVGSSGSFYGKQSANWTYSINGIPSGWNVYYIV